VKTSKIAELLSTVIDPELGIDIVSMGLVYGIEVDDDEISVAMTLTAPMCPMGSVMVESVQRTLEDAFPGTRVVVHMVSEPPWEMGMLGERARRQLGMPAH
jgi:metal-sulfur cluster biosynthetic enzyme